MKVTKAQEEKLYLLRLEGLRREITLHEAEEAYNAAAEKERTVKQYALDHGNYMCDVPKGDPDHGKRIDNPSIDFLMSDADFTAYMEQVKAAYMELYGIDNPVDFVYPYPFQARLWAAEHDYLAIAVDFLRICGSPEADALDKAIKGYLEPDLKKRLMALNELFIAGKTPAHA